MSVQVPKLQGRAYLNFINSLKSRYTKDSYRKALIRFMTANKMNNLEEFLSLPVVDIENMIIDYLRGLEKEGLSSSFINISFSSLKHALAMNDVRTNNVKISKFLGEYKKKNTDRHYETSEIRAIVETCDLRLKVAVMTMATTGMRIGALAPLKLSDVEKNEQHGVYKFTLYRNTKEQSICFCSPHCATIIDQYFQYRIRSGEHLEPSSPFIREQFDPNDIEQVRKRAKPVSRDNLRNILGSILVKSGLRQVNHNFTGRERDPRPLNHAYRKWWTHEAVNAKMQPEIREMLLGHSIGLASAYYRPDESELLSEYMRCVDNGFFSISEEANLRRKVEMLTIEKSKVDLALSEIQEMKKKIGLA